MVNWWWENARARTHAKSDQCDMNASYASRQSNTRTARNFSFFVDLICPRASNEFEFSPLFPSYVFWCVHNWRSSSNRFCYYLFIRLNRKRLDDCTRAKCWNVIETLNKSFNKFIQHSIVRLSFVHVWRSFILLFIMMLCSSDDEDDIDDSQTSPLLSCNIWNHQMRLCAR